MTTPSSSRTNSNAVTLYTDTLKELPSPQVFYKDYVKRRRPVLFLKGCASQEVTPKLSQVAASLDKLLPIVGHDTMVEVNQCDTEVPTEIDSFSPKRSRVVEMSFGEFIGKLQQGSTRYYLTTQTLPVDEEGRPLLYTTPITQLVETNNMDSLRPKLLGNLVPMTCNLWIGQANYSNPTSSGLHHDFHDNLYCLLVGTKTFRIAPPESINLLKMKGTLHTLHDNGRIVHKEQVDEAGMIRPDGALVKVEQIMKLELKKEEIEQKIAAACETKHREEMEKELDAVEEQLLDIELDNIGDGADVLFGSGNKNEEDDSGSEVSNTGNEPDKKRARTNCDSVEIDADKVPLNFVVEENDQVQFETIQMSKGDLLYLPAGWFHEVISQGDGNDGLHIAFNYWMHPPDVDNETTFESPYLSNFWQRDWESRDESK